MQTRMSSEIDLSELLVQILKRAGQLTDSPAGSVMLFDQERRGLYFAAATGPKTGEILSRFGETGPDRIPVWKNDPPEYASVAGKVFDLGESEVKDSLELEAGHFKGVNERTNHRTESMICVPLTVGAGTSVSCNCSTRYPATTRRATYCSWNILPHTRVSLSGMHSIFASYWPTRDYSPLSSAARRRQTCFGNCRHQPTVRE